MTDLLETIAAAEKRIDETRVPVDSVPGSLDGTPHPSPARAPAFAVLPVNLLALDLGTNCGWAVAKRDGRMDYGTQVFPVKGRPGARWAAFRAWLSKTITDCDIHVAYYEDVRRHLGTDAAHVYGGFLAMVEMVCAQHRVRLVKVGVGQAKKVWTGNGRAKKADMITAANKRGFRVALDEDDTADALAIATYGIGEERS